MLFGVILALLSGVLVIYIVGQATSNAGETVELVVANQTIQANTTLGPSNIVSDFSIEKYPANLVPAGAYVFTDEDSLKVHLNNTVVVETIVPGDILLTSDPRIVAANTIVKGSLTNLNPSLLPAGSILYALNYSYPSTSTSSFLNAGDQVDILVEECNAPFSTNNECIVQTTLQQVQVFAVYSSSVILVLTPEKAKELAIYASTGTVQLALRKPGDPSTDSTAPVSPSTLAHYFHS